LGHAEDEEEYPRLLLGVELGHDQESALHVDHGQAVAKLAEEEGHEAEEEAGGGFGFGRHRSSFVRSFVRVGSRRVAS
jgi:hypothetical protein